MLGSMLTSTIGGRSSSEGCDNMQLALQLKAS